jgi:glucokinase
MNDLEAMARESCRAQRSRAGRSAARRTGGRRKRVVIAAGTGFGEALLHSLAGRLVPSPSEARPRRLRGPHRPRDRSSFACCANVRPGRSRAGTQWPRPREPVTVSHEGDMPAAVRSSLDTRRGPRPFASCARRAVQACEEACGCSSTRIGAETGNLALRGVWRPQRVSWAAASRRRFCRRCRTDVSGAFRAKPRWTILLSAMPVQVTR